MCNLYKGEWATSVHLNSLIDPTRFGLRLHQGSELRSVLQSNILCVEGNFVLKLLNCVA